MADDNLLRYKTFDGLPKYRIEKDKKKNGVVRKHNKLIDRTKDTFSVLENRIIAIAISQIKNTDEPEKMYRIYIRDIIGSDSSNRYKQVRKAVNNLHKSTIIMEEIDPEDGKRVWRSYSFISKAEGKEGRNFIEVQFHRDVQVFLWNLKEQFTCYNLEYVMKFKRRHSLKLYELCKQFQKIGQRKIELSKLRTLLNIEKKYRDYVLFRRELLLPCLKEINTQSDIYVNYGVEKEGNKVESILFYIVEAERDDSPEPLEYQLLDKEVREKYVSLGFYESEVLDLDKKYGTAKLLTVLRLFEKNMKTVNLPKPWIEHALEKGYTDEKLYQKIVKKKEIERKKESDAERAEREEKESKVLKIRKLEREIKDLVGMRLTAEQDIEYYEKIGKLRPGDHLRFPKEFSVEDAMNEMKKRIAEYYAQIKEKENEIESLDEGYYFPF